MTATGTTLTTMTKTMMITTDCFTFISSRLPRIIIIDIPIRDSVFVQFISFFSSPPPPPFRLPPRAVGPMRPHARKHLTLDSIFASLVPSAYSDPDECLADYFHNGVQRIESTKNRLPYSYLLQSSEGRRQQIRW